MGYLHRKYYLALISLHSKHIVNMSNQDQFNWLNGGIGFEMAYMTDCYFVATVEYNY